jgi:hypothetical protein
LCISSVEDEGRPFEIGFQKRVSNHFKWPLLRVVVISVEVKCEFNSAGEDQKDE